MAWLTSLLKRPEPEVVTIDSGDSDVPPAPTGPQLAVLIPDIAGISSFRLRLFPDAQSACEHVSSLRPEVRRGVHSFWALHEPPVLSEGLHVETLVLIRSREKSDLVYVVSFLELESANSFTRFEVRRGLQLTNVMIYWAAFAQVREELDGVSIHPATAPITRPSWMDDGFELPARPIEAPEVEDTIAPPAVAEPRPAPVAPEPVEDAEVTAIERYLREREEEDRHQEPLIEDRFAALDHPRTQTEEPAAVADGDDEDGPLWPELEAATTEAAIELEPVAELEPEAELEPVAILEPVAELEPTATLEPEPAGEPEIFSEIPEEQAALEQAFVFSHPGVDESIAVVEVEAGEDVATLEEPLALETAEPQPLPAEALEAGMVADAAEAAPAPVLSYRGDEESLDTLALRATQAAEIEAAATAEIVAEPREQLAAPPQVHGTPQTQARGKRKVAKSKDPGADLPEVEPYNGYDIAFEVERLLRNRNWGRKDEPFHGFKSPPGRF